MVKEAFKTCGIVIGGLFSLAIIGWLAWTFIFSHFTFFQSILLIFFVFMSLLWLGIVSGSNSSDYEKEGWGFRYFLGMFIFYFVFLYGFILFSSWVYLNVTGYDADTFRYILNLPFKIFAFLLYLSGVVFSLLTGFVVFEGGINFFKTILAKIPQKRTLLRVFLEIVNFVLPVIIALIVVYFLIGVFIKTADSFQVLKAGNNLF